MNLKAVNVSGEKKRIDVILENSTYTGEAKALLMGGEKKEAANTFGSPDRVAPVEITVSFIDGKAAFDMPEYGFMGIAVPAQ